MTSQPDRRGAYLAGARRALSLPGLVLFCSFFGFGAYARAIGFTMGEAVFTSSLVWALPGQVVLLGSLADGASLAAAFVAVTLTAVRLLPLTVAILPLMRRERQSFLSQYVLAHFVAVTVWVESMRRFPTLQHAERAPFFLGVATAVVPLCLLATALGHGASAAVPATVAAGLLFVTPIYFVLSMTSAARAKSDHVAMLAGLALGPVFYRLAPGLDLLWTGLVGGTLAWLAGRAMERRGVIENWWTYVVILVAGYVATDIWRLLGVAMSARLDEKSAVLQWVRAVSTALVAGLVAKLVIYAPGELGDVALWARMSAVAVGCVGYWIAGGNVFVGVVAAEAMLIGGALFLG